MAELNQIVQPQHSSMECPQGAPLELYSDEAPVLDTPDLTDKNSSSDPDSSQSDDSDAPSSSPYLPEGETAVERSSQDSLKRDFSTTTAIHVGDDDTLQFSEDEISEGFGMRKSSDVFSTLSDEDFNLDMHLPNGHSSSFLRNIDPSTPTSLRMNRERPVFRNPSSVRAMQMSSPHPFPSPFSPSPRSARFRQSDNERTNDFSSRIGTPLRPDSSPLEARKVKKEYPLVLLHVTITPVPLLYPAEAMEEILPPWILENNALLREKVSNTLLQRGILIPHPRDDYELLEERVLESMELKMPRIYKCGHLNGCHGCGPSTSPHADVPENDEFPKYQEDRLEMEGDICDDCGRTINTGEFGTGSGGARRWDIKIYAANGLMRAGAWAAAWAEMEKVDLEIGVWIPEALRLQLDERRGSEEESRDHPSVSDFGAQSNTAADNHFEKDHVKSLKGASAEISRASSRAESIHNGEPIPLSVLLQKYLLRLAKDPRNIAIFALLLIILIPWFRTTSAMHAAPQPQQFHLPVCTFPVGAQISGVTIEAVGIGQESAAAVSTRFLDDKNLLFQKTPTTAEFVIVPSTEPAISPKTQVQVDASAEEIGKLETENSPVGSNLDDSDVIVKEDL